MYTWWTSDGEPKVEEVKAVRERVRLVPLCGCSHVAALKV